MNPIYQQHAALKKAVTQYILAHDPAFLDRLLTGKHVSAACVIFALKDKPGAFTADPEAFAKLVNEAMESGALPTLGRPMEIRLVAYQTPHSDEMMVTKVAESTQEKNGELGQLFPTEVVGGRITLGVWKGKQSFGRMFMIKAPKYLPV